VRSYRQYTWEKLGGIGAARFVSPELEWFDRAVDGIREGISKGPLKLRDGLGLPIRSMRASWVGMTEHVDGGEGQRLRQTIRPRAFYDVNTLPAASAPARAPGQELLYVPSVSSSRAASTTAPIAT